MAALGSVSSWFAASTTGSSSYDVFLNFRGEDTRNNFTAFLNKALKNCGIKVFMDAVGLSTGDDIGPALLRAIDNAKISITIFSENYADSKWCLMELDKIVQCHSFNRQKVLPVFYHVKPLNVRHQTGRFEEAFRVLEHRFEPDTVARWREALRVVGNLSGILVDETMNQAEVVDRIVREVLNELVPNSKFEELMHLEKSFIEFVINSNKRITSLETTISDREVWITRIDEENKKLRDEVASLRLGP